MENVLLVAYLLIVLALIAVILLQRSEGGGLGMGGGGGGFMTARGSANLLTRTTAILATLFFVTAIGLTILSQVNRGSTSILDRAADGVEDGAVAPTNVLDALNQLQGDTPADATTAPVDADAPDLALPVTPGAAGTVEAPATDAPAVEAPAAQTQETQPAATPQSPGAETTPAPAPTGN
jgi:preprotein translocase subunit SecG